MHCENKKLSILNGVRELSHTTICHSLKDASKKEACLLISAEGGKSFLPQPRRSYHRLNFRLSNKPV